MPKMRLILKKKIVKIAERLGHRHHNPLSSNGWLGPRVVTHITFQKLQP